jgi:hypothetical protein
MVNERTRRADLSVGMGEILPGVLPAKQRAFSHIGLSRSNRLLRM